MAPPSRYAQRFRRIGIPCWLLYGFALHAWAVAIAARVAGTEKAILTMITPVLSWAYWALMIPDRFSAMRDAFALSFAGWLLSACLVVTARRLRYELRRADRDR